MSNFQNQDIAKQVADLLSRGEEVTSLSAGRCGKVLNVDGPAVIIKLKNGRRGATGFRGSKVKLEKGPQGWVIKDEEPLAAWPSNKSGGFGENLNTEGSSNEFVNELDGWHEAFRVHIPANVYTGKYYNHEGYPFTIPKSQEVQTEQDAIKWVNSHKDIVLKKMDRARRGAGNKRSIKAPVDKNVFFKDTYHVTKAQIGQPYSFNADGTTSPIAESRVKSLLKKLIIAEMTQNQFGTAPVEAKHDEEAEKALKKTTGEDAEKIPGTGKVVSATPKHHVELSRNSEDNYDVTSYTNESDRKIARGVTLSDAMELVKKHADETEKSYVAKAREKSINGGTTEPKDEKKESDKMEETKEKKQVDVADKNDSKAEEKPDKKLTPAKDELAAQMGGEIVDKIDKIIDRVLKKNTVKLKADPDMESPDKLTAKMKDTPALKEKKS